SQASDAARAKTLGALDQAAAELQAYARSARDEQLRRDAGHMLALVRSLRAQRVATLDAVDSGESSSDLIARSDRTVAAIDAVSDRLVAAQEHSAAASTRGTVAGARTAEELVL